MKGIIFNAMQNVVEEVQGEDAWDDILDEAGVGGAYTSMGTYPDAEAIALVGAIAERLGTDVATTLRTFGQRALPQLANATPGAIDGITSTRMMLLALNDVIHPEVLKAYPGAEVPWFHVLSAGTESGEPIRLRYESSRRMCFLAEGLMLGAGDHFGEPVSVEQSECTHRGDPACVFEVVVGA